MKGKTMKTRIKIRKATGLFSALFIAAAYLLGGCAEPPSAAEVLISGTAEVGAKLTGLYTYSDENNDAEGTSIYRWLISSTEDGTYEAIDGATELTYDVALSDSEKYIKFEVTPVSSADPYNGETLQSAAVYVPYYKRLYFSAAADEACTELWCYDGINDAYLVDDIYPGSGQDSYPEELTVFNEKLYFFANNGINGRELMVYDGTGKPGIAADVCGGSEGCDPSFMIVFDDKLCFQADDGVNGLEAWYYNSSGSFKSLRAEYGMPLEAMRDPAVFNDKLYFRATDGSNGYELWAWDGKNTPCNVEDSGSNPQQLIVFNNALYFQAVDDDSVKKLWKYDGTNPPSPLADVDGYTEYTIVYDGGLYYTVAADGFELWCCSGTGSSKIWSGEDGMCLTVYDGKLYFCADDGTSGAELYCYDGSSVSLAADICTGSEGSYPDELIVYNNKLFFSADDSVHGSELWSYDSKTDKAVLACDILGGGFSEYGSTPSELVVY